MSSSWKAQIRFAIDLYVDSYVFRNVDPEKGWASRETALKTSQELREYIDKLLPSPVDELDAVSGIQVVSVGHHN